MIGLFLVTHATYGESLIQCACHVLNRRPAQIAQLGVAMQDDPLDLLPQAREMIAWVDKGDGVLVMTDIFGATPSNIAMKLLQPGRIEGDDLGPGHADERDRGGCRRQSAHAVARTFLS